MSTGRILQNSGSQNYRGPSCAMTKIPMYNEDKENRSGGGFMKAMSTPHIFGKVENGSCRTSGRDVREPEKNSVQNTSKNCTEFRMRPVLADLNAGQCAPLIVKKSRACVKERRIGIQNDEICVSKAWEWREVSDNSSENSEMSERSARNDDLEDEDFGRDENGWEDVRRRLAFSEFEVELDDHEMVEDMVDYSNRMTEAALEEAEGSSSAHDCRESDFENFSFEKCEFEKLSMRECTCNSCLLCKERFLQQQVCETGVYWNGKDSQLSGTYWKSRGMNNNERCCRWMEENEAGQLVVEIEVEDVDDVDDSELTQQEGNSDSDSDVEDEEDDAEENGDEQEESDDEDEEEEEEGEEEDEDEGEEKDNDGEGKEVKKEAEGEGDDEDEDDEEEDDEEEDDEDDEDEEEDEEEEEEDGDEEKVEQIKTQQEIVKPTPSASQGYAKGLDTSEPLHESKRIFVGGMPYTVTDEDIHSYFADCGSISEIDRVTFPDTGRFNGIAFITFKTVAAAKKALTYNGADMGGRYLKIEAYQQKPGAEKASKPTGGFVKPPPKTPGCLTVYIGNLSWEIDEDTVRNFFYGCKIQAVRFVEDKITGDFKGFGHVDFEDEASLEQAISMDQTKCLGRPMKIAYAVVKQNIPPKQGYERDGGGGGGGYGKANNTGGDQDNNSTKRSKKGGCFVCGLEGHKSYDCPQSEKGTKRQKRG